MFRSSSVATTVVVPRSKAIAWRRCGGVAGLDVDHELVADDDRDVEVRLPQGAAERPRNRRVELERDVVDRRRDPLEVRRLILERRLLEGDVALLDGRPQDDMAADADQRRLGPRLERRDVDLEVARRPSRGTPAATRRAARPG